jgi:uncharacterized membrane protein (UPF0127 family)
MRSIELRTVDGRVVCERCLVADSALARTRGLLGRSGLDPGEGLLLKPASSIHMFFMRFAIDVVFLGRGGEIRKVAANVRPWRLAAAWGAKMALELPSGEAGRRGIEVGDRLDLSEV